MVTKASQRTYGFGCVLDVGYAEAVKRTEAALKDHGFGILTTIDVQKTLKEKLGAEMHPYVILGACNPPLAHRALQAEPGVGLLLPCNVIVYDNGDGTTTVEAMNPDAALGIVGDNPAIRDVAHEATQRLRAALDSLS